MVSFFLRYRIMNINMTDVFDFYELRIKCHVASVNYFAALLGHQYPEHDSDKIKEPIRTGYAYVFYKNYHKNFHTTQQQDDLCKDAINNHHAFASHHVQHYKNVREIPDNRLYEMMADWASANFEQMHIIRHESAVSLGQWFDRNMSHLPWTEHQLEIIKNAFETFAKKTDMDTVKAIWQPLLSYADL